MRKRFFSLRKISLLLKALTCFSVVASQLQQKRSGLSTWLADVHCATQTAAALELYEALELYPHYGA